MTNKLQQNPNVFYYKHSDSGTQTEILIDFEKVVTLCPTSDSMNDSNGVKVKVNVKYIGHSKAQFVLPEEDYTRLCDEWNEYINKRNELKAIAQEMAKFLVAEIKEEMKTETEEIVRSVVTDVQNSISKEIKVFRETVVAQSKEITDTALSHQKEINNENAQHLDKMKKLQVTSEEFVCKIVEFSDRMESVVKVVNSVAPSADSLIDKEIEAIEEMNRETAS